MPPRPARLCACGCGTPLTGRRPDARYALDACRSKAWRERTGYTLTARRKPSQNAKPRKPTPSSVRLGYPRLAAHLATELQRRHDLSPLLARTQAQEILRPLLTPRQKEALHG